MSDNAGTETNPQGTNEGGTDQGVGGGDSGYTPPATQADLDRIIGERLGRERSKFADYDDLKSKAEQFQAIEDEQKTEYQRLQESLEAERNRAAELEQSLAAKDQAIAEREFSFTKSEIAREKGVPVENLTGTTREELEASAEALVKWREENTPKPKRSLRSGANIQEDMTTARQKAALSVRGAF